MGQYYRAVVTMKDTTTIFGHRTALQTDEDKMEFERNMYSNYHGAKLLEHSWWENTLVKGVIGRLYNKKGRVAWVGDYTEYITPEIVGHDGVKAPMTPYELYNGSIYARTPNGSIATDENGYRIELPNEPLPAGVKEYKGWVRYNNDFTLDNKVIINLTRREYLNCNLYKSKSMTDDGWCINPLPLLTSTGGDQGGGDYHEGHPYAQEVGRWAYDEIIIKDLTPSRLEKLNQQGYNELKVFFNEEITVPFEGVA